MYVDKDWHSIDRGDVQARLGEIVSKWTWRLWFRPVRTTGINGD